MPMSNPKACLKCGLAIQEAGNTGFYHVSCDPRLAQAREHDRWRSQQPYRQLYALPAWKRLHDFIMSRDPICKICNRERSTVADHIKDHKGNTNLFFDRNNLRGLCKPCHDKKTGEEHGFGTPSTPAPGGIAPGVVGLVPQTLPPKTLPVAPEHLHLPDGQEAVKKEYGRVYSKQGNTWVLVPVAVSPVIA